ncbi:hypothetical protein FOZ60_007626 [Perkinsus olseni]|uniref:Secreted protein n=1 Tax=Perkinsus olseni TaxID=32597 RepID=A0A7J6PEP0_PEROL|nr:hypothetical protein FOZ60_007626 [Perkinsus olseni]
MKAILLVIALVHGAHITIDVHEHVSPASFMSRRVASSSDQWKAVAEAEKDEAPNTEDEAPNTEDEVNEEAE